MNTNCFSYWLTCSLFCFIRSHPKVHRTQESLAFKEANHELGQNFRFTKHFIIQSKTVFFCNLHHFPEHIVNSDCVYVLF